MARIIKTTITGSTLSIAIEGVGNLSIDANTLSEEVHNLALLHGLRQKICDAAAMTKGATETDKFAAMTAVRDNLINGEWSKRSSDGTSPVSGLILRAFEQWANEQAIAKKAKTPPTAEKIKALYDSKTRSEQLALRNVPRIAEIIETLKIERGAPKTPIDTDALLGDLF